MENLQGLAQEAEIHQVLEDNGLLEEYRDLAANPKMLIERLYQTLPKAPTHDICLAIVTCTEENLQTVQEQIFSVSL